ncbi:MAG: GH36-type glycosyl hydrolase domain-containing protein, partial [bacterium]
NDKCWDGEWYLRAFRDNGELVGSSENEAGSLYLNAQTWAVMAEIADEDRGNRAFDAVKEKLDSEWGFQYFGPAYEEIDPEIGVISQFVPGKKENGSIFSHAAAFSLVALAQLDRREEAFELWKNISPTSHAEEEPDHYGLEPYVYCQNVTGPDSPDYGEGNYHWLSGTASWVYRAVLDHLLGIKPTYDGLEIDPAFPPDWDEVTVTRNLRGVEWTIEIRQEAESGGEVESITVNGDTIEGTVIPYPKQDRTMNVEVRLK